jgi:hypothetical protein
LSAIHSVYENFPDQRSTIISLFQRETLQHDSEQLSLIVYLFRNSILDLESQNKEFKVTYKFLKFVSCIFTHGNPLDYLPVDQIDGVKKLETSMLWHCLQHVYVPLMKNYFLL